MATAAPLDLTPAEAAPSSAVEALSRLAPGIPIPPELPIQFVDEYIAAVREQVAAGGDAETIAREYSSTVRQFREAGIDPFDPKLDEPVFEGSAEDAIRWLEQSEACASSG